MRLLMLKSNFRIGSCLLLCLSTFLEWTSGRSIEISVQDMKHFIWDNRESILRLQEVEHRIQEPSVEVRDQQGKTTRKLTLDEVGEQLDGIAQDIFDAKTRRSDGFAEQDIPGELLQRRIESRRDISDIQSVRSRSHRTSNEGSPVKSARPKSRRVLFSDYLEALQPTNEDPELEGKLIQKPADQVAWDVLLSQKPVFWMAELWQHAVAAQNHLKNFRKWATKYLGLDFDISDEPLTPESIPYEYIGTVLFGGRIFGKNFIFNDAKVKKDRDAIISFIEKISKELIDSENLVANIFRQGPKINAAADAERAIYEITAILEAWRKFAINLLEAYVVIPSLSEATSQEISSKQLELSKSQRGARAADFSLSDISEVEVGFDNNKILRGGYQDVLGTSYYRKAGLPPEFAIGDTTWSQENGTPAFSSRNKKPVDKISPSPAIDCNLGVQDNLRFEGGRCMKISQCHKSGCNIF